MPQGAQCILRGTTVRGNIKVQRGATLDAQAVRVIGNVQAENHAGVRITNASRVGGSIQASRAVARPSIGTTVTGDIQYDANDRAMNLDRNVVNGSIQVVGNRASISITSNRVDGNLQCKENRPAPTGGGNVVQGNKEDQCSRL